MNLCATLFSIVTGSRGGDLRGWEKKYLVRSISNADRPPEMPSLEDMLLERDERSLQTVPVDIPKSGGLGNLITKMFLCEDGLVILCKPGDVTASGPPHIFEYKPVQSVLWRREHHVIPAVEKCVDLQSSGRK